MQANKGLLNTTGPSPPRHRLLQPLIRRFIPGRTNPEYTRIARLRRRARLWRDLSPLLVFAILLDPAVARQLAGAANSLVKLGMGLIFAHPSMYGWLILGLLPMSILSIAGIFLIA